MEKYDKKQIYEYCQIRSIMVRLDVIRVTATMPDYVHAEVNLLPVGCNRAEDCRREGIRCIVYDKHGSDPCPEAWKGEF
ncbi:hypothetical protein LLG46_00020 [bacterium]|nr:hypothetical protein [bacterium]